MTSIPFFLTQSPVFSRAADSWGMNLVMAMFIMYLSLVHCNSGYCDTLGAAVVLASLVSCPPPSVLSLRVLIFVRVWESLGLRLVSCNDQSVLKSWFCYGRCPFRLVDRFRLTILTSQFGCFGILLHL